MIPRRALRLRHCTTDLSPVVGSHVVCIDVALQSDAAFGAVRVFIWGGNWCANHSYRIVMARHANPVLFTAYHKNQNSLVRFKLSHKTFLSMTDKNFLL